MSNVLPLTAILAKVSINSRDPVLLVSEEKDLYRRFTPREALFQFSQQFQFSGSEGDAYRQIGNAIPPVVMWHLAKSTLQNSKRIRMIVFIVWIMTTIIHEAKI